jgi:hypothetical protein
MSQVVYLNPNTLNLRQEPNCCKNMCKKLLLVIFFLGALTCHIIAETGYFWDTIEHIYDHNETLITPPAFIFGLWGFIYIYWLGFMFYQLMPDRMLSNATTMYLNNFRG